MSMKNTNFGRAMDAAASAVRGPSKRGKASPAPPPTLPPMPKKTALAAGVPMGGKTGVVTPPMGANMGDTDEVV